MKQLTSIQWINSCCLSAFVLLGLLTALMSGCAPEPPPPAYPTQRFVKLSADGQTLVLQGGPWACVADQQTQLVWEVKHRNETAQFTESTYSWFFNRSGYEDGGSCGVDHGGLAFMAYQRCDTQDLIDQLNHKKLCGFDDWRLPSLTEWQSLWLARTYPGALHIPHVLLPYVQYGPYWTNNTTTQQQAFTFHPGTGEVYAGRWHEVAYVMAVRGRYEEGQ